MVAKIIGFDFSPYIVTSTYEVNSEKEYYTWQDGNYSYHKELKRKRVVGEFEIKFPADGNVTYTKFIEALKSVEANEVIGITLFVTNENVERTIFAYYSFYPVLRKNYQGKKVYDSFKFELEEY